MHVRRALALALSVPLLLAGCSDDPEPTPKMPDPTTTSSTPTPTETETAEAERAEEFIRRWVEAGDEMQVTGETEDYSSMTPDCRPCQAFVGNVEEVYADGGRAEFAGSKIIQIKRVGDAPPTYHLTKDLPETVIRRGDGDVETLPSGRTTLNVTLGRKAGRLVIAHFTVL